ncbi:Malate/lactate/ureidoglycolate dehydrogenase, LDH2 family [Lentibacillus halodurans]|uniref:Malate/lactate/ureidoglycolate dehydrogenase, LDH2 family n=1 Tax=Lentibacillus halodurans TaxID=237679 RepID=A0A1I0XEE2_9BACI|nr:Ldh family oxidoreductase [Lentibacillus halodurans]SFA99371.1 Malate/lactate/ureidoglycolate dehydrogenase, LDH2 family [Lentibacillus halodurans]
MTTYINRTNLENYVTAIFQKAGIRDDHSATIARHLVLANLRGVDSHGVTRVKSYIDRLERGVVNREHNMKITKETPASILIDGANELGIIPATEGIRLAVEKAKDMGVAIAGINHSNHCGMLADYTGYAAEHDCVCLATTNAPSYMAPWGGKERYFGTNPISYGIPGGEEGNIVFDMATSIVARGKIKLAIQNHEDIPVGWAITKEGEPTTDAQEAMDGLVLPVGGPKGYGLALLADVLSGLLTGAAFGPGIGRPEDLNEVQEVGQFFFVIRADIFEELNTFKNRMDSMASEIKQIPAAKGYDKIYLPGEIENETANERNRSGIPLTEQVIDELHAIGRSYGISIHLKEAVFQ